MFKFLFKSKFLGFVEAPVGIFHILLMFEFSKNFQNFVNCGLHLHHFCMNFQFYNLSPFPWCPQIMSTHCSQPSSLCPRSFPPEERFYYRLPFSSIQTVGVTRGLGGRQNVSHVCLQFKSSASEEFSSKSHSWQIHSSKSYSL